SGDNIIIRRITPEEGLERVRIFRDLGDLGDDILRGLLAHFDRVQNRKLGLFLECWRAAIPELRRLKHRVQYSWRVTLAVLVLNARRCRTITAMIGKSLGGLVAGLAGNRVVDRKPLVVEQFIAESGKLRRWLLARRHSQGIELR